MRSPIGFGVKTSHSDQKLKRILILLIFSNIYAFFYYIIFFYLFIYLSIYLLLLFFSKLAFLSKNAFYPNFEIFKIAKLLLRSTCIVHMSPTCKKEEHSKKKCL